MLKPYTSALAIFMVCSIFSTTLFAQDKLNIKFGKVSPADFNLPANRYDTAAAAVVIADIGFSQFQGNNNGGFTLLFERKQRIKILKQTGMDAATFEISLYVGDAGSEEKLDNLKANTYNLEEDKVVETKLNSAQIFKDRESKYWVKKKFTMPAVKPGSLIEVSYTISSEYLFNLRAWAFQGEYPRLWSEYEVSIPEYFHYVFLNQGYEAVFDKKFKTIQADYRISASRNSAQREDNFSVTASVDVNKWIYKDVPALKIENFTSAISNHITKIEFQLSTVKFPNSVQSNIMGDWNKMGEQFMEDEDFGLAINRPNNWLDDEMPKISKGASAPLEKAKLIYYFIKDTYKNTGGGSLKLTTNLKSVFSKKSGTQAEINLLMTAMLLHEKMEAYPVFLSTRPHGYTNEIYPLIDRFNYVVVKVIIENTVYYLDASEPALGFNKLSDQCYNGHARVISKIPLPVYFYADSLNERKQTTVIIDTNDKGESEGGFTSNLGYYESLNVRNNIKEKGEADFFSKIKSAYLVDVAITNPGIDSLRLPEYPVKVHYEFKINNAGADFIYFSPMLTEAYKDNPFKSLHRKYPVEMPYASDEVFNLIMYIPVGYEVDELPKSAKVSFNDDDGYFEYLIEKTDDRINLRSRIRFKKTKFMPDEYDDLRSFFALIVKKQNEQVVFKKK